MTISIDKNTIAESIAESMVEILKREQRAKLGLAMVMSGCEPTKPALSLAGSFYGLAYGIYTLDVVRGVVEIAGTTGNLNKAADSSTVAQMKQVVLESIAKMRKALDDYEQFVRIV